MEGIDDTDIKILSLLQENAKLTTKELAAKVNLSPTPVFERLKRLEREGYIDKYVAILNAEKLGNGFVVFCNIKLKQHSRTYGAQFMDAIMQMNEVTECYNTSGEHDFMMKIYAKSMKHYQDFVLNKLGMVDSIGSLHSVFVIGEIKHTCALPLSTE